MDLRPRRPSTLSLKLFGHGGGEKERKIKKKMKKMNGGGRVEILRARKENMLPSYLSWFGILIKSLGEISLMGLKHK